MDSSSDKTLAEARGPQDDAWSPPREFDGFEVRRLLGRGGMGCVYLAQDTSLDRPVAIRFIAVEAEPGSEARQRFLVEARAIARLLVGAIADHDAAWSAPLERAWTNAYHQIAAAMRRGLGEARAA